MFVFFWCWEKEVNFLVTTSLKLFKYRRLVNYIYMYYFSDKVIKLLTFPDLSKFVCGGRFLQSWAFHGCTKAKSIPMENIHISKPKECIGDVTYARGKRTLVLIMTALFRKSFVMKKRLYWTKYRSPSTSLSMHQVWLYWRSVIMKFSYNEVQLYWSSVILKFSYIEVQL